MPKRWLAAGAALAGWTMAVAAPPPLDGGDKVLERHGAMVAQAEDLLKARRAEDALPIAAAVIRETDARLSGEKRQIYSGQSTDMVLANMLAAAARRQDAVDVGPPLGRALFIEGFALIELGRKAEAGPFLDRAAAVSPSNPQYLCEAAAWHAGQREFDAARDLYRQCATASSFAPAVERERMQAAAERGQGYVLIEQGRYDEAEAIYRQRLKAEPGDEKARNELRYIRAQREKDGKQAI